MVKYVLNCFLASQLSVIVENECPTESGRSRLMHEMVKMKSLFEEKIDIEMRVKRDLQIEFEHLKTSSREKLQAANESKSLLKQEIDSMRFVNTMSFGQHIRF